MHVNVESVTEGGLFMHPMESTAESITGRVRALRMRAGLSMEEFAHALGRAGASSVQRYESPTLYPGGYLKRDLVALMERALVRKGAPPISKEEVWELAGPEFAATFPPPPPNAKIGEKIDRAATFIPLYGQAVGGVHGEFVLNGNKLAEVLAPPSLSDVSGAYAVRVSGESMEPRYFDGETVYVDPHHRIARGDFVVAQILNDHDHAVPLAYVKRFIRWNVAGLVLEQYNPAEELRFDHERVVSVHFIVMGGAG